MRKYMYEMKLRALKTGYFIYLVADWSRSYYRYELRDAKK